MSPLKRFLVVGYIYGNKEEKLKPPNNPKVPKEKEENTIYIQKKKPGCQEGKMHQVVNFASRFYTSCVIRSHVY